MNRLLWLIAPLFLVGCSTGKIVDFLAFNQEINGVIDFISVYIRLSAYIWAIGFLLDTLLLMIFSFNILKKEEALVISGLFHLIWMIIYRDYGFWNITLLFLLLILMPIIRLLITILKFEIIGFIKRKNK